MAITNGSKADGSITMSYDYGAMEQPEVQWEDANIRADQYCKSWGYTGHQYFDPEITPIAYNAYGSPIRWRVTYKCQCTNK